MSSDNPPAVWGAGSLKLPFSGPGGVFAAWDPKPRFNFGASGTLAGRIMAGEPWDLYCSANMDHPRRLQEAGLAGPAVNFAANSLAALCRRSDGFTRETIVAAMLDPARRVGMSTPVSDPSGDYALKLFQRIDAHHPGAGEDLMARARILTGGGETITVSSPIGTYGGIVEEGLADIMLAYVTVCLDACEKAANLAYVRFPAPFEVGARYGAAVSASARPQALALLDHLTSAGGRKRLAGFGFGPPEAAA